jgi:hypothetical protein
MGGVMSTRLSSLLTVYKAYGESLFQPHRDL